MERGDLPRSYYPESIHDEMQLDYANKVQTEAIAKLKNADSRLNRFVAKHPKFESLVDFLYEVTALNQPR